MTLIEDGGDAIKVVDDIALRVPVVVVPDGLMQHVNVFDQLHVLVDRTYPSRTSLGPPCRPDRVS